MDASTTSRGNLLGRINDEFAGPIFSVLAEGSPRLRFAA